MPNYAFKAFNASTVSSTTNLVSAVATGTNAKTMLQLAVAAGSTTGNALQLQDWGFSFDGAAAGAGVEVELISSTAAATSGTALTASDVFKFTNPNDNAPTIQLGAGLSAFSMTSESTIASARIIDAVYNQPTNFYAYQWPYGIQPVIALNTFLRVRVKAAATVNMLCWVSWIE